MHEIYGDEVAFVGVAGRDDLFHIENFISDRGVDDFPHIFDDSLSLWSEFGVTSQPAFVFIDADGNAETIISGMGEAGLSRFLDELVA